MPVFDESPAPVENEDAVLDDDERQSIREWFRGLVKARGARSRSHSRMDSGDETWLTRDLTLPGDVASDVKGGGQGGAAPPPEEPDG